MPDNQAGRASSGRSNHSFSELRKRAAARSLRMEAASRNEPTSDECLAAMEELRIHQIELEMQNEELQRTLLDLERSRARYFEIYELAPIGYVTLNEGGMVLQVNLHAASLLGALRDSLHGHPFFRSIFREDRHSYSLSFKRLLYTRQMQSCEVRLLRPNAPPLWVQLQMSAGIEEYRPVCRIVMVDVHEHRTAKERLEADVLQETSAARRLQAQEEELRRSLAEKDTLLFEVHHRVKNNLQMVSNLLRMQADLLSDAGANAALKESQHRVLSMAMIHERLYGRKEIDQVDFEEYAQTLVTELFHSYTGRAGQITSRLHTERVVLKSEQAIPCSLILNELVTNAIKYAYPNGRSGEVVIELKETGDGRVTLAVSDRGVGMPEGLDWENSGSIGMPIVALLTKQISGSLTVHSNQGTQIKIEFPKRRIAAQASAAATR